MWTSQERKEVAWKEEWVRERERAQEASSQRESALRGGRHRQTGKRPGCVFACVLTCMRVEYA